MPQATAALQNPYSEVIASLSPGSIALFRIDRRYDAFGDHAEKLAQVLGLALISNPLSDAPQPSAGFPADQLEEHLRKLVRSGYRVAICDRVK